MKYQGKTTIILGLLSMLSLGGCVAPQGSHHNNAVYDAPTFDSALRNPKYTEDFYYATQYHDDIAGRGI